MPGASRSWCWRSSLAARSSRRRFDPEALDLIAPPRDGSGGGAGVRSSWTCRPNSETAHVVAVRRVDSRCGDVVIAFMDQFGDVICNNYNATKGRDDRHRHRRTADRTLRVGPEDSKSDPGPAGSPRCPPAGPAIVHNDINSDGYTSGAMAPCRGSCHQATSGYLGENGRLFVVGRDAEMIVRR